MSPDTIERIIAPYFTALKLKTCLRRLRGEGDYDRIRVMKKFILSLLLFPACSWAAPFIQGYHLDISRCKIPTMETFERMILTLEKLGYNQLQLYTEHTFAYPGHEVVWQGWSPMTGEEIRALDALCASHGIELVPNQNSFGHLDHWLKHPGYNDLAEIPAGGAFINLWGGYVTKRPSALCPTNPRSLEFLAGLYDSLFPCFKSTYVNVGCDETHDLMPRANHHEVYVEFLNKIHALCAARGHTMMFWSDIIFENQALLGKIPEDAVCLDWNYEHDAPFEKRAAYLEEVGRPFMLCPGTSSWGSLFGRTGNMMTNIVKAVSAAKKHGAMGVLLTDWGDGGHPQPWLVSIPALVYLSELNKGNEPTREELAAKIDELVGCTVGKYLLTLGDTYQQMKGRQDNTSEPMFILREGKYYRPVAWAKPMPTAETKAAALKNLEYAKTLRDLSAAPDWVKDDCATLDLLAEALRLRIANPAMTNFRARFEPAYRALWLKSNRPGGLEASLNLLFGVE